VSGDEQATSGGGGVASQRHRSGAWPTYRGVYSSWDAAVEDAFATAGWLDHCRAEANLAQTPRKSSPSETLIGALRHIIRGADVPKHLASPVRQLIRLAKTQGKAAVLDIGGGYGDNYFSIYRAMRGLGSDLYYEIVDNNNVMDFGRDQYREKIFSPTFSDSARRQRYDMSIIVGTLQYIEKWEEFVRYICSKSPGIIHICRSPLREAGEGFLTRQDIVPALGRSAGVKVGEANVRVISRQALSELLLAMGYEIRRDIFNCSYSRQLSNLPMQYRNVSYRDITWVKV
jgi:putative methyltransferase (TIGR04325 family)